MEQTAHRRFAPLENQQYNERFARGKNGLLPAPYVRHDLPTIRPPRHCGYLDGRFAATSCRQSLYAFSGRFYEKTNGLSNLPRIDKKIVNRATISFPKFFPKRCRNRKNECIIIRLYNIKLAFMQLFLHKR